jgi:large subunit ribosomal protein L17
MKKKIFGRQLSRDRGSRRALFRSLVKALATHGSIKTTEAKAKAVQPHIDKLVNLAKQNSIAARRKLYSSLANDRETTDAFFNKIIPALTDRKGGYTRTIRLPPRRGDLVEMVKLEWVKEIVTSDKKQVTSKAKKEEKISKKKSVVKKTAKETLKKISSRKKDK